VPIRVLCRIISNIFGCLPLYTVYCIFGHFRVTKRVHIRYQSTCEPNALSANIRLGSYVFFFCCFLFSFFRRLSTPFLPVGQCKDVSTILIRTQYSSLLSRTIYKCTNKIVYKTYINIYTQKRFPSQVPKKEKQEPPLSRFVFTVIDIYD